VDLRDVDYVVSQFSFPDLQFLCDLMRAWDTTVRSTSVMTILFISPDFSKKQSAPMAKHFCWHSLQGLRVSMIVTEAGFIDLAAERTSSPLPPDIDKATMTESGLARLIPSTAFPTSPASPTTAIPSTLAAIEAKRYRTLSFVSAMKSYIFNLWKQCFPASYSSCTDTIVDKTKTLNQRDRMSSEPLS
jgi:hypothetical protein